MSKFVPPVLYFKNKDIIHLFAKQINVIQIIVNKITITKKQVSNYLISKVRKKVKKKKWGKIRWNSCCWPPAASTRWAFSSKATPPAKICSVHRKIEIQKLKLASKSNLHAWNQFKTLQFIYFLMHLWFSRSDGTIWCSRSWRRQAKEKDQERSFRDWKTWRRIFFVTFYHQKRKDILNFTVRKFFS